MYPGNPRVHKQPSPYVDSGRHARSGRASWQHPSSGPGTSQDRPATRKHPRWMRVVLRRELAKVWRPPSLVGPPLPAKFHEASQLNARPPGVHVRPTRFPLDHRRQRGAGGRPLCVRGGARRPWTTGSHHRPTLPNCRTRCHRLRLFRWTALRQGTSWSLFLFQKTVLCGIR